MAPNDRKRPWLAAMLALQPGLGHAYLRSWVRAALWFGLWVATVLVVVPAPGAPATEPLGFLAGLADGLGAVEFEASLALASVTVFSVLDAYWLGARELARSDDFADEGTTGCPTCGRDVDPELAFCHWCTAELDAADPERGSGETG